MGALNPIPEIKPVKLSIPSEVLDSVPLLDGLGIDRLLFTPDIEERKMSISKGNIFIGEVKGIYIYRLKKGTTYGLTPLNRKVKISRFYSYLVELSPSSNILDGISNTNQKMIVHKDKAERVIAYVYKNDSQTLRVRLKREVVEDGSV